MKDRIIKHDIEIVVLFERDFNDEDDLYFELDRFISKGYVLLAEHEAANHNYFLVLHKTNVRIND